VQVRRIAEDLDRVLVRADRPVRPKAEEHARTVSSGSMSSDASYVRLVRETSSLIPIVNRLLGCSRASSSNTPATIPGVNSFEDRP
jgi:hypothetical protein